MAGNGLVTTPPSAKPSILLLRKRDDGSGAVHFEASVGEHAVQPGTEAGLAGFEECEGWEFADVGVAVVLDQAGDSILTLTHGSTATFPHSSHFHRVGIRPRSSMGPSSPESESCGQSSRALTGYLDVGGHRCKSLAVREMRGHLAVVVDALANLLDCDAVEVDGCRSQAGLWDA